MVHRDNEEDCEDIQAKNLENIINSHLQLPVDRLAGTDGRMTGRNMVK